jgi:polysaccharide export outer membrane protein
MACLNLRLQQLIRRSHAARALAALSLSVAGGVHAAEPLQSSPSDLPVVMKTASADVGYSMSIPQGPQLSPADPHLIPAVDCVNHCPPGYQATWDALGPVWGFQEWAQGEYVGRARLPHVPTYRLRVDDQLDFVFRVTRDKISGPYKLNVGDEVQIESAAEGELRRTVTVLPDGSITLPLIGSISAAGMSVGQLRDQLDEDFKKFYNTPAITVTPIKVDTQLEDLRYTVSGRSGFGGQVLQGRVTPEGTIQLPAVGSVPAQGLTLDEFKVELGERFAEEIQGVEVMPVLRQRAPRFVYVLGEVQVPGRYVLEAPTTVMQAISLAGSWTVGGKIANVVIFRRADDWRLIATSLDLSKALLGKTPCPAAEIWVGDSDLIIVPKSKLLRTDNFIDLVFTRGLYGVIPFNGSVNYTVFRDLTPVP